MAAEKSRLLRSRTVYRGQITKLQNKFSDAISQDELTEDDHDTLIATLESTCDKLDIVTGLDKQISVLTTDDDLEQFLSESDDYLTSIKQHLVKGERKTERKFAIGITNPVPSQNSTDLSPSIGVRRRTVMLPKLNLKTFDGDVLKWPEFYDSFKSAIDSHAELTNVEKFQYLRAQLEGEAASTIDGLSLTSDNYANALSLLKERFGQPHKVIDALFNSLWNLPIADYNLDSLRDFHNQLEINLRGLSTMGKDVDEYGEVLIPLLRRKMPQVIRTQFARDIGNRSWTLKDFRSALLKEIETIQASGFDDPNVCNDNLLSTAAFHMRTSKPSGRYHTGSKSGNFAQQRSKFCVYCKGSHSPWECTVILDKKKRHEVITRDRLCFNCLGKHKVTECKSKLNCRNCNRRHHTSICSNSKPAKSLSPDKSVDDLSLTGDTKVTMANLNGPVLLKTAVATIASGQNSISVNLLFDEGAQRSFIIQDAVDALNIKCNQTETVQLSTFGEKSGARTLPLASFKLRTMEQFGNVNIKALVVPSISTPMRNYISKSVVNLPHLRNLKLAHPYTQCDNEVISLLIGADLYWSIVGNHVVRGPGPIAMSSKLGYLLSGPTRSKSPSPTPKSKSTRVYHVNVDIHSHQSEDINIQRFWDLETIGVRDDESESIYDYTTYSTTHISKERDHYVAKLPWKDSHDPLPTNHRLVVKRTRDMTRRLPLFERRAYDQIIQDQLSKNYIEPVLTDNSSDGHYLAHRAVIKESSSTPMRIVYDCSFSQSDFPSLNDCLQTGPSLLNDLTSILLRFRTHPVGLSADISKAFLQIGLDLDDRKFTKFLWLSDYRDVDSDFNVFQFRSILFGARCSPFILNSTIRRHLEDYNSVITTDLSRNIYVDNVISGCNNTHDAVQYYNEANRVMASGGFQLHSWSTNDQELRHYIELEGSLDPNPVVNVLGFHWDTHSDNLTYQNNLSSPVDVDVFTKRMVIQQVAKVYDPLGYLTPVLTRAKVYIQELWKANYEWDQPISDDFVQRWYAIANDLSCATSTVYERKYFQHDITSDLAFELHAFSDASQIAYGAAVYLRDIVHGQTALVMAKSRIAPTKELTIPRLELLGVLIASKLLRFVFNALSRVITISKLILWTDSQIVLCWLDSSKKLPIFVSNRLKAIRSNAIDVFKYCPSNDNPADMISRGITFSDFSQSDFWWHGPDWLRYGDWPISHVFDSAVFNIEISESDPTEHNEHNVPDTSPVVATMFLDTERFSTLSKLYRVTAYVQRFVYNSRNAHSPRRGLLLASEIDDAEKLLLKRVQHVHYKREIGLLSNNKPVNQSSLIRQLQLFLDDEGLLRVGGRLHNAPLSYEAKFPVLLPASDYYTKLIIRDAHLRAQHAGVEATITLLRQTYWITRVRRTVRAVLHLCVQCKTVSGLPYALPMPAPLQSCRLQQTYPFNVCGIDYTGALHVKSNVVGKQVDKAYVLLFTCASTRAIHLETVSCMSVNAFLSAFRRFVARRSLPRKLLSDNAMTFLSARTELSKLFDSCEVTEFMLSRRIEWSTITKRAAWQGGFWERLIGITKATLKRVLGRALVSFDELSTVVAEAEMAINNRPLTYLSSDLRDPTPLTPSHMLHGRILMCLPHIDNALNDINDVSFAVSSSELNKRFVYLSMLQNHFWERWAKEYVTALRERHLLSLKSSRNTSSQINVGDIVLVHGENKNRMNWKLAKVIKLIAGGDQLVRSAEIKMKNGVTNRPVNKLYPLEVCSTETSQTTIPVNSNQDVALNETIFDSNDVVNEFTSNEIEYDVAFEPVSNRLDSLIENTQNANHVINETSSNDNVVSNEHCPNQSVVIERPYRQAASAARDRIHSLTKAGYF